jgi:hypothetical protein
MLVSEKPEAEESRHLIPIGNEKYALSPFAALYGPNASGKMQQVPFQIFSPSCTSIFID